MLCMIACWFTSATLGTGNAGKPCQAGPCQITPHPHAALAQPQHFLSHFHCMVRPPQPKNYLDYISTYRRLLQGQRRSNEEMATRLSGAACFSGRRSCVGACDEIKFCLPGCHRCACCRDLRIKLINCQGLNFPLPLALCLPL
jgi:hypothetical protein